MAEPIVISGVLTDPLGAVLAGTRITLTSTINSASVLKNQTVSIVTDADGNYSFSLLPGGYSATVEYSRGGRQVLGQFNLQEGSAPGSLNDYILYGEPVLADPVIYNAIRNIHNNVTSVSGEVRTSADNAASAAKTASDAAQGVTADKDAATAAVLEAQAHADTAGTAASDAAAARDEALTASSAAKELITTAGVMPDIATGLAKTASGDSFAVAQGTGSDTAFIYYRNNAGTAVAIADAPGVSAVTKAQAASEAVAARTGGLNTTAASMNPFEIMDSDGKGVLTMDTAGKFNMPGGVTSPTVETDSLAATAVTGDTVTAGALESKTLQYDGGAQLDMSGVSGYLMAITDSQGRIIHGWKEDTGQQEYLGFPLKNKTGLLNNDFFYIGDSITAFTETTSAAYNSTSRNEAPCVCQQGWPIWAEMMSDGRIKYAGISATGGYRADQILATHVPNAVAAAPTFCVVLAGRNNVVQSYTYAQTAADLQSIYLTLRKAGITPVLCSMPAQSGNTDAQNLLRYQINEFIRAYAEANQLPFVDFHKATTDPLTGEWYSGWNYDASHPTSTGAKAMATALVNAMGPWVLNVNPRMAVSNTTPAASTNLITNPLFLTSASGTAPDGWTVITAGTTTLGTDSTVSGNVWNITAAANYSMTIAVTARQSLAFGVRVKMTAATQNAIYIVAGSSATGTQYLAGIKRWHKETDGFGYFYKEFTVPTGVTAVTVVLNATAMSLAQIALFQLMEI